MRVQEVRGLVLVNPATSYERSNLARFGPICAALQGPLLYPLYILSLLGFAALVLTPTYQAPAFISMLAATKIPTLLNNPYREAWLGRVDASKLFAEALAEEHAADERKAEHE